MTRELVCVIEAIYPKEDAHCPKITKSKGDPAPPGQTLHGPYHLRCEGPRRLIPADRSAPAAQGRSERARRAARRRRVRSLECFRRAMLDADRRATRGERPQVQSLPHDSALLANPTSVAHRQEPPRGGDGWDHRARHLRARLHLDPPQYGSSVGRDSEAEWLFDGAIRQVP